MKGAPFSRFIRTAFALAAALIALPSLAAIAIKDVRVWAGPESTRVVLDLSGPAKHSVMTLSDPARVVVDITAASARELSKALPENQGFLKQIRVGDQGNGDVRIVIDLAAQAAPKSFAVAPSGAYGHRLVVDLEGISVRAAPSVVKSASDVHGRDIIVAIDAGHGGQDPGSIGKRGTREKHVTLAIARELKKRIDREPGMRAVLTRDNDQFIALRDRIVRARKQQADMFVSIHADAYHDRSVAGSSVYVLSARGASDESARWLANRENAADLVGGVKLDDKDDVLRSVLLDLSQGASMSASIDAADKVMNSLYQMGNVTRRGVKHAGFLVLKSPDIPSILVETAFISNPTEEARLITPGHQQRLAEAIFAGVRTYFYESPPPGTHFAQLRARGGAVIASTEAPGEARSGISP